MLPFMRLTRSLRSIGCAAEALKDSAEILLARGEGAQIIRDIDEGRLRIPSKTVLCKSFIRADLVLMTWRRKERQAEDAIQRFLTVDASPQGGYDYHVCHQELWKLDFSKPLSRFDPWGGFE